MPGAQINILKAFYPQGDKISLSLSGETSQNCSLAFVQTAGMCLLFISLFVSGSQASQAVS